MTLSDGKRKVLMLLDEYSSGGELTVDEDILNKMHDFFDMAQKEMANYKRIVREVTITLDGNTEHELPADFVSYFRIWKNGRTTRLYPVRGNKLICSAGEYGELIVEYFAMPQTISPETDDSYEFEVSEDAANCLPFYVAAQQLITDLVVDYSALWNMYLVHRSALDTSLPSSGSCSVRQALFSTGR